MKEKVAIGDTVYHVLTNEDNACDAVKVQLVKMDDEIWTVVDGNRRELKLFHRSPSEAEESGLVDCVLTSNEYYSYLTELKGNYKEEMQALDSKIAAITTKIKRVLNDDLIRLQFQRYVEMAEKKTQVTRRNNEREGKKGRR
jgi:hypothetical protein